LADGKGIRTGVTSAILHALAKAPIILVINGRYYWQAVFEYSSRDFVISRHGSAFGFTTGSQGR